MKKTNSAELENFPPKVEILFDPRASLARSGFSLIFLLRGTRNEPPTLVLHAQCSTYLYTPNLAQPRAKRVVMMMMIESKSFYFF